MRLSSPALCEVLVGRAVGSWRVLRLSFLALCVVFVACELPAPLTPADGGSVDAGEADAGGVDAGAVDAGAVDAGELDAGVVDAGAVDAGELDAGADDAGVSDAGAPSAWRFVPIAGSKCALGAQAGIGYNEGAATELLIYVQGGGACWNAGTCQPSWAQWGPICNYGSDAPCLADYSGGTQSLAAWVSHPDPFPADGGGAFPSELASVSSSLLFARRPENPLQHTSMVFVPYCTGDLHSGDAERTYSVRPDAFGQVISRTHHFAGATNLDLYFAWLRAQHPVVNRIWFVGVSGGGYGASLNLSRLKRAFPEAEVHLLADSAPMLPSAYWAAWSSEWNLQLPQGCSDCDAGLPEAMRFTIDEDVASRVALLAFDPDSVITRFFYSAGTTGSWATPPYSTYSANLVTLENAYDATPNARYFTLGEETHVMLQRYGVVLADGGISAPTMSRDGGVSLRAWIDAWATGTGAWESQR